VLWCIWKRRNEQILKDDTKQIQASIEQALDFLDNWELANQRKQIIFPLMVEGG